MKGRVRRESNSAVPSHQSSIINVLKILPGSLRRPADLLIPFAGTNGQDLCLDVTVTAALKRDSIERGAEEPGHAANEAHRRKENQVGEAVQAAGMAIRHDHDVKKTISSEFKVLNCLLMRGNAKILLNRCVVLHPPPSQNEFPEL